MTPEIRFAPLTAEIVHRPEHIGVVTGRVVPEQWTIYFSDDRPAWAADNYQHARSLVEREGARLV